MPDQTQSALPAHLQVFLRASQVPVEPPPYHKLYVAVIDNFAEATMASLEKESSDPRFSEGHKLSRLKEVMRVALPEVDRLAQKQITDLEATKGRLTTAARPTVTPSETQVAQLAYTRDALQVKWTSMTLLDMYKDWQAALDAGDLVTARVYRDFSAGALRVKTAQGTGVMDGPLGQGYETLVALTNEALSTPEQRKARSELPVIEETILRVNMAHSRAVARLQNARIDRSGKLIDGSVAALQDNLRSQF